MRILAIRWRLIRLYGLCLALGLIPLGVSLLISEALRDRILILAIVAVACPVALAILDAVLNSEADAVTAWATRHLLDIITKHGKIRQVVFLPLDTDGLPKEDAIRCWLAANYRSWNHPLVARAMRQILLNRKKC